MMFDVNHLLFILYIENQTIHDNSMYECVSGGGVGWKIALLFYFMQGAIYHTCTITESKVKGKPILKNLDAIGHRRRIIQGPIGCACCLPLCSWIISDKST